MFGQDALAVARRVAPDGGLVGFGHSMGGAALLMAARTEPDRFERLVLYEPIAMPLRIDPDAMDDVPIVQGARRRRRTFDSFDEAVHNYRSKPPMSLMTREVLHEYVDHGFRRRDDGTIELRCTPEYEAAVFIGARSNGVWEILPDIAVPTVVVAGRVGTDEPSEWAAQIADRLPFGTVLDLPHLTHFGPFSHPTEIAAIVDDH